MSWCWEGGLFGLAAIQSTRIIVVEPIKVRRDLALKLGATMVMDPNVERKGLVEKIRERCRGKTDHRFAGGRAWGNDLFAVPRGPDFTIEAVGGDTFPPKMEAGPDPTGVLPLQQAWEFTRGGGHIITLGSGQKGYVSFPAMLFANRGRTVHSGQPGGLNMLRDLRATWRWWRRG
jgi:S-(hydroxymethyl)glutathione dehydrogenase/alcohol dehydrogenase